MTLEKLMKAFLYLAAPDASFSHNVVEKGLNALDRHAVAEAVGMSLAELRGRLDQARPTYLLVAAASPSIGFKGESLDRAESERTQNVEYPWQRDVSDPSSWVPPASHAFPAVHSLRYNKHGISALGLLGLLVEAADALLADAE